VAEAAGAVGGPAVIARALHATDRAILAALEALLAGGGRVTDARLAEVSGITRRTVKKRRLAMIARGDWPGPVSRRRTPPEVVARIKELGSAPRRPSFAAMIRAEFGLPIHSKAVERHLTWPGDGPPRLAGVRAAVRREALREYRGRRDPEPPIGVPVKAILARHGVPTPRPPAHTPIDLEPRPARGRCHFGGVDFRWLCLRADAHRYPSREAPHVR
jgi:hypothetical protein